MVQVDEENSFLQVTCRANVELGDLNKKQCILNQKEASRNASKIILITWIISIESQLCSTLMCILQRMNRQPAG